MKDNIDDIKLKADTMVLGTRFTVTDIEVTKQKVSGKKLGNSKFSLRAERAIIITAFDGKYKEFIAFEFPTVRQFENHFERAMKKLKKHSLTWNHLTKESITSFETSNFTDAQTSASLHLTEDKWADVLAEVDEKYRDSDDYYCDF